MKKLIVAIATLACAEMVSAQVTVDTDPTDFGLWVDAGLEKSVGKKFDVGAEFTLRTQDALSSLNRWAIGVSADYKPIKLLSVGVAYSLIDSHYEPSYTTKGNIVDEYWRLKNRFSIGAKLKGKWGVVRPSLRLRYQLTKKSEVNVSKYASDGVTRKTNKVKTAETDNTLRTKVSLSFKTNTRFTPALSYELYNDLKNSLSQDKGRLEVGTSIKLNKHNALGVGYVHTFYRNSDDADTHNALSISYKLKL